MCSFHWGDATEQHAHERFFQVQVQIERLDEQTIVEFIQLLQFVEFVGREGFGGSADH